jgi:hypothetical protein
VLVKSDARTAVSAFCVWRNTNNGSIPRVLCLRPSASPTLRGPDFRAIIRVGREKGSSCLHLHGILVGNSNAIYVHMHCWESARKLGSRTCRALFAPRLVSTGGPDGVAQTGFAPQTVVQCVMCSTDLLRGVQQNYMTRNEHLLRECTTELYDRRERCSTSVQQNYMTDMNVAPRVYNRII